MRLLPALLFSSLAASLCLSTALAPAAAAGPRYTTVIEETADGHREAGSAVEAALVRELLRAGVTFVDDEQSRKIRSVTDAGTVIAGVVPEVITSLDADVIVFGVAKVSRVASDMLGQTAARYDAVIDAKVVAVDTAQVLGVFSVRQSALDYRAEKAARTAADKAGAQLAKEILEKVPRELVTPSSFELSVSGVPDVATGEAIVASVRAMSGVKAVRVLQAGRGMSKLAIDSEQQTTARELALSLSRIPGLTVFGYTGGAIKAEHSSAHASVAQSSANPLELTGVDVEDIYPARYGSYADRAIGKVKLVNRGAEPARRVVVSASVPGLTRSALDTNVADLAPGASIEAPVKVVLDRDLLAKENADRPVVLALSLVYEVGGRRIEQSTFRAVRVFDKNALSWRDEASVGGFVTAKDPEVVKLAKLAHGAVRAEDKDDPLALPAAMFAAMKGLKYSPDPAHPYKGSDVDYVLFPAETLAVGGGDCDDLAVLFAAIAEAVDLQVVLLTTPGHVFVAADTGLPARNAAPATTDSGKLFAHEGRAFVPIETTRLGGSFPAAWDAAAKQLAELSRQGVKPGVIDVRRAWERYPAASLNLAGAKAAPLPAGDAIAKLVLSDLTALKDVRAKELERAVIEIGKRARGAAALNERGVLYASVGRYAEAKQLFERAAAESKSPAGALNNLGNLSLLGGGRDGAKDALARYAKALALEPKNAQVHINAAIAAWVIGDEATFGEHIASSLALGAEGLVSELAESGLAKFSNARGREDRGDDTRLRVTRFVYWL